MPRPLSWRPLRDVVGLPKGDATKVLIEPGDAPPAVSGKRPYMIDPSGHHCIPKEYAYETRRFAYVPNTRHLRVGREWLIREMPELWAAYVADKLLKRMGMR